jgi:glyoxylase-like metal-dependent hydrolase (beta-lactamase superfamily II)
MMHQADRDIINNTTLTKLLGMQSNLNIEPDEYLKGGEEVGVTDMKFKVVHTPGHTEGSICLAGQGMIFTGDLLFSGGIGRYDLPGGDGRKIMKSLEKVTEYPDETKIYPGHGPSSTIGAERRGNFYLINLIK